MTQFYEIEAEIRYLVADDERCKTVVVDGCRRQFYFNGSDEGWDGFPVFPDHPPEAVPAFRTPVRALVRFHQERWDCIDPKDLTVGMPFELREGARIVGRGVVKKT